MYTINCGSAVAQSMIIPFVVVLFFRAALEKERLVEEEKARRAIVSQHRSNTVLSSVQFGVDALVIPEEIDEDLLSDNESEDSAEIRRRQQFERRRCNFNRGKE
ncbi:hypothetical protein FOZ60_007787 [Perkinsus olseni]|uniref:Uncharacterized protein n=1 Tax=Perkinsus olseni TaxID=32597 RepID=A0A7J6PEY6_PEROL|nr:hypothetical protein FOZ60_007787 [Perkinsus olseni]